MPNAQHMQFTGSIPAFYDRYLGPVLFEPFARDHAKRLLMHDGVRVLETACGTGVMTRPLLERLPASATLVSRTQAAGFRDVKMESVAFESTSDSAEHFSTGLVRGNPVAFTISERGTLTHEEVELHLAEALRREMGDRPLRTYLQSWLVTATA